jgi:peptidoglycan/xylan/chitin deacetylase (PgdA/CDA1 family)
MIGTTMTTHGHHKYDVKSYGSEDIRVLLYHGIVTGRYADPYKMGVDQKNFQRQIETLDHWGYTTITFEDLRLFQQGEIEFLPKKPVIITFDDADESVYEIAFPLLKSHGMKAVLFVIADLSIRSNNWDTIVGAKVPLLTERQIFEMKAASFEIGSHSLRHGKLTELPEAESWDEIFKSRTSLEHVLNGTVQTFAYPYGLVETPIKKMVSDAGYKFACASYTGSPKFGHDPYEIRRIKVRNTGNLFSFWFQLNQMYGYYRWLVWKSKGLAKAIVPL